MTKLRLRGTSTSSRVLLSLSVVKGLWCAAFSALLQALRALVHLCLPHPGIVTRRVEVMELPSTMAVMRKVIVLLVRSLVAIL